MKEIESLAVLFLVSESGQKDDIPGAQVVDVATPCGWNAIQPRVLRIWPTGNQMNIRAPKSTGGEDVH